MRMDRDCFLPVHDGRDGGKATLDDEDTKGGKVVTELGPYVSV